MGKREIRGNGRNGGEEERQEKKEKRKVKENEPGILIGSGEIHAAIVLLPPVHILRIVPSSRVLVLDVRAERTMY